MALFAGKLHKEIERLDALVAVLQENHHDLVTEHAAEIINLKARHDEDRRLWKEWTTIKERGWDLERARLEGKAEANKDKADLYDEMIKPFNWEWNGTVEINDGKKVDALVAMRANPHQSWRIPYPEGKRP